MDFDLPTEKPDLTLQKLGTQDLSTLSLSDLAERIAAMKIEIARCESLIAAKSDTRAAAERLFKI